MAHLWLPWHSRLPYLRHRGRRHGFQLLRRLGCPAHVQLPLSPPRPASLDRQMVGRVAVCRRSNLQGQERLNRGDHLWQWQHFGPRVLQLQGRFFCDLCSRAERWRQSADGFWRHCHIVLATDASDAVGYEYRTRSYQLLPGCGRDLEVGPQLPQWFPNRSSGHNGLLQHDQVRRQRWICLLSVVCKQNNDIFVDAHAVQQR